MDTIQLKNRALRRMFLHILIILIMLAMVFPTNSAVAAPSSPFLGQWRATDIDGSDIRLTIAGRPEGPFQITWTESYLSFCSGEAGIVRGTGWLNGDNPNLLEADLHVECFTTEATLDFHLVWRYHPMTNTLSSQYDNGLVTIWKRPGGNQVLPPAFGLRVMYGDDWVESFYEGGHTVWITVTEADGVTVKATAEVATAPRDEWGGETGFQTRPEDWIPAQPDIRPNDWVFGWLDNGASAQVQIGDIRGAVHLTDDFIDGTIHAPWFSNELEVECHSWGAPLPEEILKYDTVLPDGEDTYACSWFGEWDIQPYQNVGVGYSGPDGNWVATYFYALNPRIVASEAGDWFWTTEFNLGTLDLFLYESADQDAALLWSGHQEVTDIWGVTFAGHDLHAQDIVPGNYLVVSDGVNSKGLVLETITIDVFDTENEIMAGSAPLGRDVWAAAGPQEWQERIMVTADAETGAWFADFKTIGFDITEDMRPWSYASVYDDDGDANEGSTPQPPPSPTFVAYMPVTVVGYNWPVGHTIDLSINDGEYTAQATVGNADWEPTVVLFELWRDDIFMEAGDHIVMTDETAYGTVGAD